MTVSTRIAFRKLQVKGNFVFSQFNFFLGFSAQSAKTTCLRFTILNCSKKVQNIFEIALKKCGKIVQKYFKISNSQTRVCNFYVKLATVQMFEFELELFKVRASSETPYSRKKN